MKIDKVRGDQVARGDRENVQFELSVEPERQVFVAGTFNNWSRSATPLEYNPDRGHFKASLHIPKGTYEYLFVVNGVWVEDPKCAERVPNGFGTVNNVLHV